MTRRGARQSGEPGLAEIDAAVRSAADVVRLHGDAYLPILERLLEERSALDRREALRERAIRISQGAE